MEVHGTPFSEVDSPPEEALLECDLPLKALAKVDPLSMKESCRNRENPRNQLSSDTM